MITWMVMMTMMMMVMMMMMMTITSVIIILFIKQKSYYISNTAPCYRLVYVLCDWHFCCMSSLIDISVKPRVWLPGCDQELPWSCLIDRGGSLHGWGLRTCTEADVQAQGTVSNVYSDSWLTAVTACVWWICYDGRWWWWNCAFVFIMTWINS